MSLFLEEIMKRHIGINSLIIIIIIVSSSLFLYLFYLNSNKDEVQKEGYFISEKTSISKEELKNSKIFFNYVDSIYEKEYDLYNNSLPEDSYSKLIYDAETIEDGYNLLKPDKTISIEGFDNVSISAICGGKLLAGFFGTNRDQLGNERQIGKLVYDIEKEEVLFTLLPDDCNYSVVRCALSENYIYWCEAIPYDSYLDDTWTIKGMDFQTRTPFTIFQTEDFKNTFAPNMGRCYKDSPYFYFNTEEEITKEYPDLEIQSVTNTAYGFDLLCYNPEEDSLLKKAEFNFIYNPYAYPYIAEENIYTVDYDGDNWYILGYHIPTETYTRYKINMNHKSEYVQGLKASSDYVVYQTNFSRYFLLDLHTLEVREISKSFSWYDIVKDNLFFSNHGYLYCYNISENIYYKLLEEKSSVGYIIICNDNMCAVSNNSNREIYLFYR